LHLFDHYTESVQFIPVYNNCTVLHSCLHRCSLGPIRYNNDDVNNNEDDDRHALFDWIVIITYTCTPALFIVAVLLCIMRQHWQKAYRILPYVVI